MAVQLDPSVKDDLKTQFVTREGTYRLMTLSEYSRPNRVGYTNSQSSPQVRVSIVTLPSINQSEGVSGISSNANSSSVQQQNQGGSASSDGVSNNPNINNSRQVLISGGGTVSTAPLDCRLNSLPIHASGAANDQNGMMNGSPFYGGDRICFNFGKELYVYAFRGVKKGTELSKPIDKKLYKGTNPSCHDFNLKSATIEGAPLLVGFTTGQIQLVHPGKREQGKLYNEERLIDKTKVTCLKWLPNSPNLFLASHASGHLYLYNEELPCSPTTPNYQPFKLGDGYTILTCKSKSTRNPLYKWVFSTENCSINEFCFSPCGSNLAIVSQDGFLRVFHYDTMELLGIARSYFGGFLCVCWSPDGKYIVVGGEDDLVTVWSLSERRVVARGQGHRSWVSVVAFDPYTTSYNNWDGGDFSDDENPMNDISSRYCSSNDGFENSEKNGNNGRRPNSSTIRDSLSQQHDKLAICYRLGSVSQDTQLCLWDITEDVLRHSIPLRQRNSSINANSNTTNNCGSGSSGLMSGSTVNDNYQLVNGELPNENFKILKPITSVASANIAKSNDDACNNTSSKNSSNSSKFSTANCITSDSASCSSSGINNGSENTTTLTSKHSNSKNNSNLNKLTNCINATKSPSDTLDSNCGYTITIIRNPGNPSKSSEYSIGGNNGTGGLSAFNSITQRLTNFSFSSDKNHHNHLNSVNSTNRNHNRKTFSLSKSSGNYHTSNLLQNSLNSQNTDNSNTILANKHLKLISSSGTTNPSNFVGSCSVGASSSSSSSSVMTSYDPMKLIGTPACPRFDECPILEPLICKKIAHERLTALIFREDCFLTACQDGFIYTWARPGYSNVPQHMSPNPSITPGGTVV
ncbi:WD repeat-containing protein 20 [Condylostylus longicornis]|uniref:WD repeat-containing protein 20 n=1 Tax=Condylostylus longicornis TaxID=2530218 RepID=UPI00244E2A47|nr:WD repeat-containing protein 20 [Condylostylus longicornis]